jgi:hypothetical protein
MTKATWDGSGQRKYETGVDHGMLYKPDVSGVYNTGFPWNGLSKVTESPSGAEATAIYADNIQYLNLLSAEKFGGTIEAFTYPDEFLEHDGSAEIGDGVTVGQQTRKPFGFSYRSLIGDDLEGNDAGYILHLVYGALASPSEKARETINETPAPVPFSWAFTTTPVPVPGFKPSAHLQVNSIGTDPDALAAIETLLYGTDGTPGSSPSLPTPEEVIAILEAP